MSRFKNHKLILLSEYLKTDNFLKSYLFLRTVKKDSEDVYDLNNSFESDFLSPIDKLRETDLNDIMKKDIKNILAENYLRKTDYATMSNSLESSASLTSLLCTLDNPVKELFGAFSVPSNRGKTSCFLGFVNSLLPICINSPRCPLTS